MSRVFFTIKPHSIIDVITNSSTEIFCAVFSKEKFKEISDFLGELLGREVVTLSENDEKFIEFSIERGDNENITDDFVKLMNKILEDNFGKDNFEIRTDVDY